MVEKNANAERSDNVYCAHCGTKNDAGAYSCARCGERIYLPNQQETPALAVVECLKCAAPNEARASYCVNCGVSLDHAARITLPAEGARRTTGVRISPRGRDPSSAAARQATAERAEAERSEARRRAEQEARDQERAARRKRESGDRPKPEPATGAEAETPPVEPLAGVNDSGSRTARLPDSARGWNTAAFLIGPVWGPANGVWFGIIGLLFLALPYVGWPLKLTFYLAFGMGLGYFGNLLAWRARRWKSTEHFKRVQQQWMMGALVINVVVLVVLMLRFS